MSALDWLNQHLVQPAEHAGASAVQAGKNAVMSIVNGNAGGSNAAGQAVRQMLVNQANPTGSPVQAAKTFLGTTLPNFASPQGPGGAVIGNLGQGVLNTAEQALRFPAVAIEAGGRYVNNPSLGLGGAIDQAQQYVPNHPLTAATQAAASSPSQLAQKVAGPANAVGGMLPYVFAPGADIAGKLGLEGAAGLAAKVAEGSGTFAGISGAQALGSGANLQQTEAAMKQGAITGAITHGITGVNPVPNFGEGPLASVPRAVTNAAGGYGVARLSGQNNGQAIQTGILSALGTQAPKDATGVGKYASNLVHQDAIGDAASKLYAKVEDTGNRSVSSGKFAQAADQGNVTRTFTESSFDQAVRTKEGLAGTVDPHANMSSEPKVQVTIGPKGNVVSVVPERPEFGEYLERAAKLAPDPLPSGTESKYPRAQMADPNAQYSTVGAQARVRPPGSIDRTQLSGRQLSMTNDQLKTSLPEGKNVLYRGTGPGGTGHGFNQLGDGIYLSKEKDVARFYSKGGGSITAHTIPENARLLDLNSQEGQDMKQQAQQRGVKIQDIARASGYDGIEGTIQAEGRNAAPRHQLVMFDPGKVSQLPGSETNSSLSLSQELEAKLAATKQRISAAGWGTRQDGTFGPLEEARSASIARTQGRQLEPSEATNQAMQRFSDQAKPWKGTGTIDDALHNAAAIDPILRTRSSQVENQLLKIEKTPQDTELINQAKEHPERIDQYASQSRNPEAFKKAIQDYQQFTDFVHRANSKAGVDIGYRENYLRHNIDLTDPAQAEKFAKLQGQYAQGDLKPGYLKTAYFKTLDELRAAGFDVKKESAVTGLRGLTSDNIRVLRAQELRNGMNRAVENGAVDIKDTGGIPHGYTASRISGLENTAFHPDVQAKVGMLERAAEAGKLGKTYDYLNHGLKETKLSMGGFHAVNIGTRGLEAQAAQGILPNLGEQARSFLGNRATDHLFQNYIQNGTVDTAAKMGVQLSGGAQTPSYDASAWEKLKNASPLKQFNDSIFRRQQDLISLRTVQGLADKGKIDLSTPEGRADAQKLAKQINAVVLTVNRDVVLRDPNVQRWIGRAVLAPSVVEAKVTQVAGMASPNTTAGRFAIASVLGSLMSTAILAEVSKKIVTGHFSQSLKEAFTSDVSNPSLQTGLKDSKGRALVANLPTTPASEFGRPLTSAAQGDLSGVARYGLSRLAAVPSFGLSAATNTDYYGNPIVNPFNTPNPSLLQRALETAKTQLPIAAVQANKTVSGQSPAVSALNTAGLRVGIDPNDPKQVAAQAYFGAQSKFVNSLDPNEKALYNQVNPIKKDAQGNVVFDKNALTNSSQYHSLVSNPAFLAKYQQYQAGQANHDPLWDLKPDQLSSYLSEQAQPAESADDKAIQLSKLPADFFDKRNAYFQGLVAQGTIPASTAATFTTADKRDALSLPALPDASSPAVRAQRYSGFLTPNSDGSLALSDGWKARQVLAFQNNGKPNTLPGAAPGSTFGLDPLYTLPDSQAAQVIFTRSINALDPAESHLLPTITAIKGQQWYKDFQASESTYYQQHPIPPSAGQTADPYPAMPAELSALAHQISVAGTPAAKAQLYATPQGKALDAYYATLDQYNTRQTANLLRSDISVPATKYAPGYTTGPAGAPNLQIGGSGGTGSGGGYSQSSVQKALFTSASHRAARKTLGKLSKKMKVPRVKAPKFKSVNASTHGRKSAVKPAVPGPAVRGTVRRPAAPASRA